MRKITLKEFEEENPLKKFAHPDVILLGTLKLIGKIGVHKFLCSAGLNKERDAFIGCLFAYALRRYLKKEWFIQQVEDPPDFYLWTVTERSKTEKPFDKISVEVIEVREENPERAIELVERKKLTAYAPHPKPALLVFLNSKNGVIVSREMGKWTLANQKKFQYISEVYFLYFTEFSDTVAMRYKVINGLLGWSQECILKEEFNRGVQYPHPLIDEYGVAIP